MIDPKIRRVLTHMYCKHMVPKLWFETGTQILRSHHCDTMGQAAMEGKKLSSFMESLGINTEAHNGGVVFFSNCCSMFME